MGQYLQSLEGAQHTALCGPSAAIISTVMRAAITTGLPPSRLKPNSNHMHPWPLHFPSGSPSFPSAPPSPFGPAMSKALGLPVQIQQAPANARPAVLLGFSWTCGLMVPPRSHPHGQGPSHLPTPGFLSLSPLLVTLAQPDLSQGPDTTAKGTAPGWRACSSSTRTCSSLHSPARGQSCCVPRQSLGEEGDDGSSPG